MHIVLLLYLHVTTRLIHSLTSKIQGNFYTSLFAAKYASVVTIKALYRVVESCNTSTIQHTHLFKSSRSRVAEDMLESSATLFAKLWREITMFRSPNK